jgi:hypothetical protein
MNRIILSIPFRGIDMVIKGIDSFKKVVIYCSQVVNVLVS